MAFSLFINSEMLGNKGHLVALLWLVLYSDIFLSISPNFCPLLRLSHGLHDACTIGQSKFLGDFADKLHH